MQTYEILVSERSVRANSKDMTLVRTSIGIDQVHVLFDNEEWLDFPITVTFAQGEDVVTIPITVGSVSDSEWVAEATVTIPHEVIDMTGPIRVTFQGTDSSGRHIITAKGSPLSVEEAGDVVEGSEPSDAPTVSEWQQAYADAQALINQAQSLVSNLEGRLDAMVADATASIPQYEYTLPVATDDTLGGVKIGNGIGTLGDGTIFVIGQESSDSSQTGIDTSELERVAAIVDATIAATYSDGELQGSKVLSGAIPIANIDEVGGIYPDGTSIVVDDDGMAHAVVAYIPVATEESTGSVKPDGETITVDQDGTIHGLPAYVLPTATTDTLGGVIADGGTITVDQDGTISVATFTEEEIIELTPMDDTIPDGDEMSW